VNERRPVILVAALAAAIGIAIFAASRFLSSEVEPGTPSAVAREGVASKPPANVPSLDESDSSPRETSTEEHSPPATRDLQSDESLALPDHDALAELEAHGRALFFGLVRDFAGEPCPGATVFHRGIAAGVSDASGRYRVEVAQNTWNPFAEYGRESILAAVKPGVGACAQRCGGASRRIDLQLEWKAVFAGRCVARSTREPVQLAQVELLGVVEEDAGPLFTMTATCDEAGAFRFVGTPPGTIEVRAHAKGFSSDGWFPYDVSAGLDRVGIEFELEPQSKLRGWFTPWPPPDARRAQVVALVNAGRERGPPIEPTLATVGADGRFELPFATSTGLDVVLEAGGGALWRVHLAGSQLEGGDVDLGRIELAAPVVVTGTLALPREILELGFGIRVRASTDGGERTFDFPVAADGSFRAAPLPPCLLEWTILVGDGLELRDGEFMGMLGEGGRELLGGGQVDLGVLHLGDALIAGRVTDEHGVPAAGAVVRLCLKTRSNSIMFEPMGNRGTCDRGGRYFFVQSFDGGSVMDQEILDALADPIQLSARRRHAIGTSEKFVYPAKDQALRIDLKLIPGGSLHGRVLGEDGKPLADGVIEIRAAPESHVVDTWLEHLMEKTDSDGCFEAVGLEDADYDVSMWSGRKRVSFGRVRPGPDAVTLTPRPGE
jgi:hypothetical protein